MRGVAGAGTFYAGAARGDSGGDRSAPRGEWAGSDFGGRRARTEHAGLGERDARVSVPAVVDGGAPREAEGELSARGGQDSNGRAAIGRRSVRARDSRGDFAGLPTTHPGDALFNLVTFSRTWIRPWAFYAIEDKAVRDALLALFPDGCYVAFAGDTYCESRNESMDDRWRVMHALPGDGQNRPSVGDSLVQIQERYNTLSNIQAETYEYGIPPIYADPQVLDFDALSNQTAEPAAHYPARSRPGQPLAAGFFQPAPAQVPPDLVRHQQELMGPVSQFLTGLFPAVFGGEMDNVKTATGYAMARDQALGRLGLVWRRLKQFYCDMMLLSVDCFRKNRPEDAEIPILGPGGEFESRWIRLADLKGNIQAYPESDETFPRLKSQQRGVVQQLMASSDPLIQQALADPANIGFVKSVLGLSDLVVPGEDSRNKQLREIDLLLHSAPSTSSRHSGCRLRRRQRRTQHRCGTQASKPVQRTCLLPSVPVDLLFDNHVVELEECRRWANSDAGQIARIENPAGFANVRAHAEAHLRAIGLAYANAPEKSGNSSNPQIHVERLALRSIVSRSDPTRHVRRLKIVRANTTNMGGISGSCAFDEKIKSIAPIVIVPTRVALPPKTAAFRGEAAVRKMVQPEITDSSPSIDEDAPSKATNVPAFKRMQKNPTKVRTMPQRYATISRC